MIAIPAIDLRDGACVQLVGGAYDRERVRLEDPIAVARRWRELGFRWLHVVDLDAATERGSNDAIVTQLLEACDGVSMQVGGGVRTLERTRELVEAGAVRVVVGTRALEDRAWLETLVSTFPKRVVVAVDVRDARPVVRGWSASISQTVNELLVFLSDLSLAAVLVTGVDVEGALRGPDLELIERAMEATRHPVIAAGGITTLDDLRALDVLGVAAAVIGMALYTGDMEAAACAARYGGNGTYERHRS
jgi:phosphoribosylformimino-5-aminoimidazole carboxamide ribotide isomerase